MSFTRLWRCGLTFGFAMYLAACGGGGGSSTPATSDTSDAAGGSTTPPNTPPPAGDAGTGGTGGTEGSGGTGGSSAGGDTGGGSPTTPPIPPLTGLTISPTHLSFNANTPNSPVPMPLEVTATYHGTVSAPIRVVALSTGWSTPTQAGVVDLMTVFTMNGQTGRSQVYTTSPDLLGPGTYTQTIIIKACINSNIVCSENELPGSPQTLTVTYSIGQPPAPPNAVMPRVAIAGTTARVIIRGSGLGAVTRVHFGAHAATQVTVVNDTEVHAMHPPLTAGAYSVVLNSGAVPFTGSIVAVVPSNYASELIALPENPNNLSLLRYDAERQALLAGGSFFPANGTNKLWRFAHDGITWGAPQTVVLAGLNDAVLSADGANILALADTGVIELSAHNLTILHTTPRPNPTGNESEPLYQVAIANNGMALIVAGSQLGIESHPLYYFSILHRTFSRQSTGTCNGHYHRGLLGTQDGSVILGSVRGVTAAPALLHYNASTSLRSHVLATDQRKPSMAGRDAHNIAVNPRGGYPAHAYVYASDRSLLGVLPGPTNINDVTPSIRLIEVNPQGTRAYVLREGNSLHTYALDQPTVGGAFVEIGSPQTIVPPTASSNELFATMTADGRALFIGGNRGVLVIPTLN